MKKSLFYLFIFLLAQAALFSVAAADKPVKELVNSWSDFVIHDFDQVHSPVARDSFKSLIFGKLAAQLEKKDMPGDLADFFGRWEGVDVSPPVKKDYKMVLLIREINPKGGEALLWGGTNLQYPTDVKRFHFNVIRDEELAIEGETDLSPQYWMGNNKEVAFHFSYDPVHHCLQGGLKFPGTRTIVRKIILNRDQSFVVFKDYPAYLTSKHIYAKDYKDHSLATYGQNYLVYLPRDYGQKPGWKWPLLLFLCGTGDKGDNIYLLAKASPYMMIREKTDLPFIIVAPSLKLSEKFRSFPEIYMEGVLKEILTDYPVDRQRIYLTGLSMGGEATYRFALHHPEQFAAIAPLCAALPSYLGFSRESEEISKIPLNRLKGVPIWAIHGADDRVVAAIFAQSTVARFNSAGVKIKLSILPDHDHDVWTDTYMDPAFYEWFLSYKKR